MFWMYWSFLRTNAIAVVECGRNESMDQSFSSRKGEGWADRQLVRVDILFSHVFNDQLSNSQMICEVPSQPIYKRYIGVLTLSPLPEESRREQLIGSNIAVCGYTLGNSQQQHVCKIQLMVLSVLTLSLV